MSTSEKINSRKEEILQSLATMLESHEGTQRITTAKLAAAVGVSEAALYRHFPNKAAMFESLIVYIEEILLSRINKILQDEKSTFPRLHLILALILGFAEKNPGLARIMTGHALMFEQEKLQARVSQLFERIETQLRQIMREHKLRDRSVNLDESLLASQLIAICEGLINRFVRSGFRYLPTAGFEQRWRLLQLQFT